MFPYTVSVMVFLIASLVTETTYIVQTPINMHSICIETDIKNIWNLNSKNHFL